MARNEPLKIFLIDGIMLDGCVMDDEYNHREWNWRYTRYNSIGYAAITV